LPAAIFQNHLFKGFVLLSGLLTNSIVVRRDCNLALFTTPITCGMDGHKQIKILARRKQEYEPEQVSSYENPISESPIESFFTPNCSKKQKMSIVSLIHSPEDMVR
jgi:hypothetical protein